MQQRSSSRHVDVQSQTWSRDSHGLFDYESQTTVSQSFQCDTSGYLSRSGDQLVYSSGELPEPAETLASLQISETAGIRLQPKQEVWLAVRFLGENGLEMRQGQVLKLGRVKYLVKSLYNGLEKQIDSSEGDMDTSDEDCLEEGEIVDKSQAVCRVCWERGTDANPLLSQCRCSGSIKFIHLDCQRHWLASKVTIREIDGCVTYLWKTLECEVCKTALPLTLHHKGKWFSLFSISKPDSAHIILETEDLEIPALKCVHVISFDDTRTEMKLGRGHNSTIRVNDISVSRCHAVLKLKQGKFILEDCNSKFGTLMKVEQEITLGTEKVTLQMGRSLVTMSCEECS